jgi:hypothetical protein
LPVAVGSNEGLERIPVLAKLNDIAFWVMTVTDEATLKLPFALRWIHLSPQGEGFRASRLDA